MRWTATILVGWAALAGLVVTQKSLPPVWWMEAGQIVVSDGTTADVCLPMEFDRTFHRNFYADWVVTIMRRNATGGYYTFETFRGSNDYRTENELPDDLDLCWWTWSKDLGVPYPDHKVQLPVGTYRVHTLWKLRVDGGTREIRRKSIQFTIKEAETS